MQERIPNMAILEFETADAQLSALIDVIVESLRDAITERGSAVLAVSGGNSPKPLYEALSKINLPWHKVDIIMVDDRFVELGHKASNETMIRQSLLKDFGAKARFWALYDSGSLVEVAARRSVLWSNLATPDCAVLGMGSDGHTASWFPCADGLENALSLEADPVVPVVAKKSKVTGDYLERLTVSYKYLAECPVRVLLISGSEKRAVFEQACGAGATNDMPIRALIRDAHSVTAYWTE